MSDELDEAGVLAAATELSFMCDDCKGEPGRHEAPRPSVCSKRCWMPDDQVIEEKFPRLRAWWRRHQQRKWAREYREAQEAGIFGRWY